MSEHDAPVKIISPRRGLIVMAVLCAVFTAMGVVILMLAPTKTLNLVVGVGAIGFFGLGGGISFVTQWRRSTLVRADDEGLRLGEGGRIRWQDVDRIGTAADGLGIRLRRYEDFLAHAPRSAGHTAASLRASRTRHAGFDLAWPQRLLGRPAAEAARMLRERRPER